MFMGKVSVAMLLTLGQIHAATETAKSYLVTMVQWESLTQSLQHFLAISSYSCLWYHFS